MNKVFIENYKLVSKHGYYKEEHFKSQRFVVSVWCDVSPNKSGIHDNLKETFNYEVIRKVVADVILGEHKKLLETLAEEILNKVLENSVVERAEVKITKPDIWGDCEPGVQISKTQDEGSRD